MDDDARMAFRVYVNSYNQKGWWTLHVKICVSGSI